MSAQQFSVVTYDQNNVATRKIVSKNKLREWFDEYLRDETATARFEVEPLPPQPWEADEVVKTFERAFDAHHLAYGDRAGAIAAGLRAVQDLRQ